MGFVLSDRSEERIRIPSPGRRLQRHIRDVALSERFSQSEHVLGHSATTMQEDHGAARFVERRT